MKKILVYIAIISTFICYPSYAAVKNSYAEQVNKRMETFEKRIEAKYKNRDENDLEYRDYITELYKEWDKELNSVYQKVINSLNNDSAKKHLIQAQKEWIKFKDSSEKFKYYLIAGTMGGTMGINPEMAEKTRLTKARTLYLAEIYDFITGN